MPTPALSRMTRPPAVLALEDGTIFRGQAFGALGETGGEVVFNTSMSGYQESLTDPSYFSQIVTMTYPLIGNYGVNDEDVESNRIQVAGYIVKEPSIIASNWRSKITLEEWLKSQNIVGLCGIDTRALVRKLRSGGVMRGVIRPAEGNEDDWVNQARQVRSMIGADLACDVTIDKPCQWHDLPHPLSKTPRHIEVAPLRVVAYDFGVRQNILRRLVERVKEVYVVPANTSMDEVLKLKPDGVFLSNGPGDPQALTYAVEAVRGVLGKLPVFGVCLGHQILGQALGLKTFKLKFGHRGANQPVKDLRSGKVEITTQNHGFCVDANSLTRDDVEVTHINLNDDTVEGLASKSLKCFSVQYHPEASPGPHDATYHFDNFVELMKRG